MRSVARGSALLAAVLVLSGMAVRTPPTTPALAASTTVSVNVDSFVIKNNPSANKGSATNLRIRNTGKIAYLRFVVPELGAGETVSGATLEVFATTGSQCTLGAQVLRAANDTWGEGTITWSNQPGTTGPVLATEAWAAAGARQFDVGAAVTGPGPVSFALRHAIGCRATADAAFRSKEAGLTPPQLIVETGPEPVAACADGLDNDFDGLTDHPDDPGCTDAADTDETDPPLPGSEITVAAAGDIVCNPTSPSFDGSNPGSCQHRATSDLLSGADAVLPLGDLQYPSGSLAGFNTAYDPSWGQSAVVTYPVPGNHEYQTSGALGFFDYWTSKGRPTGGEGYHSFDLGAWHFVGLNSSGHGCTDGPACAEGSPQNDFLEQDLAATTASCILAYWHAPLFNSGGHHGDTQAVRPFWDDLYAAGADIVLNGHEHSYQRFAKQDPSGTATPDGIREFVVGTGGTGHYALSATPDPNLEFGNADSFGVLRLTLEAGSYWWQFVAVTGAVLDSGGPVDCN